MRAGNFTRGAVMAASALLLSLAPACAPPKTEKTDTFDRERLEAVEDASEEVASTMIGLANALLARDEVRAAGHLAERVSLVDLPTPSDELSSHTDHADERPWIAAEEPIELSPAAAVSALDSLLAHFGELEDFRLKVKGVEPEFDPASGGEARVQMKAYGRGPSGQREWLRVYVAADVFRDEGAWRIRRFDFEEAASLVARRDFFHEVSSAAGVAVRFPRFGEPPNDSFVSHGAAAGDADGDGLIDIAATGLDRNYLYLNRGDGTFADVSEETFVAYAPPGTGVLFFDHDADGDQDLFLARVGEQALLENRLIPDGELRYLDVSERAGVTVPAVGFSVAAADVDGNGYTDVYVASYNRFGTVMPNSWHRATNGTPNLLFLNRGDGTFVESAREWGIEDSRWSYAAAFADYDGDGDQDLYVANDFGENAFYRNDPAEGRFTDVAADAGVIDRGNGMGVSFGDPDGDGDLDLHVTNMSSSAGRRILARVYDDPVESPDDLYKLSAGNTLYENVGDGVYRDVSEKAGPFSAGWAWGGGFVDLDNDGWEDIYTPNGFISGKTMDDT